METVDLDKNTYYTLASDTSDERSIPMRKDIALGDEYDRTNEALKYHFAVVQQQTQGQIHRTPIGSVIQGIWLVWCYVAFEFERLREELRGRLESPDQSATIAELQESVVMLNGKVAELEAKLAEKSS